MNKIVLKKPPQGSLRIGHPWVYKNQIQEAPPESAAGELVDIMTGGGRWLARGYWNPKSEISARILTRQDVPIDAAFLKARLADALAYRERTVHDTNAMRLVNSEADGLPGLIVDRYDEVLVVQFLTLGMEKMRPAVLEALDAVFPNRGIYERSDAPSRRLEGLQDKTGWIHKDCGDEVVVYEKDVKMAVRFGEGHKTGLYLDQRDNRFILRDWQKGGKVLDAFCYEAAFGLQLARNGCQVTAIDASDEAIARAHDHCKRNSLEKNMELRAANVFDALKAFEKKGDRFDLVILDPPSFARQREALSGALSGYREIILRAMRILNDGGSLAVFSCAYHVDENLLMQTCLRAAADSKKDLRVIKFLKQSADHPMRAFIPETYYLKGFLLSVTPLL